MISYQEAINITNDQLCSGRRDKGELEQALGLVLAEPVLAPIDLPPFRQSAMDGYALIHGPASTLEVVGEMKAGDEGNISLRAGQAIQIFTGAPLPPEADTILIQEHTKRVGNQLSFTQSPTPQQYIRPKGEQIKQGELVFPEGMVLDEAAIGLLASLGLQQVLTYQPPNVGLILTGNELVQPGHPLPKGKIYDSNGPMLKAALKQAKVEAIQIAHVKDGLDDTIEALKDLLDRVNILIISGGISVGKYDVVQSALAQLGVECLFYQVAQKPGKPLWFGRKDQTYVFALPGNPASSLTCYYLYVLPFIRRFRHFPSPHLPRRSVRLAGDTANPLPRTLFAKGSMTGQEASVLTGQSSAMLHTYAQANALVKIPPHTAHLAAGSIVACIDLTDRFRG